MLAQLFAASAMLNAAHVAQELSVEKAKKLDVDRETGYQQRDWTRIREAQERAQRSLDPRLDEALLGYWMRHAAALPAAQRITGLDKLAGLTPGMAKADSDKAIEACLDRLIAGTKLGDKDVRLGLLDKTPAQIAATPDSFVELALLLDPLVVANREAEKRYLGQASRVRPRYAKALLAEAGGLVAPDANSTLRVTYGQVKARAGAQDGIDWRAFTTLAGIERKHTGEGEFDAPDAELAAIQALRAGKTSPYVAPELGRRARGLPLDGRHHRRQLGLAHAQRQGRVRGPRVRRHLRHRRLGLRLRPRAHALDPRRRALPAVDDDRGGRRPSPRGGDGRPQ